MADAGSIGTLRRVCVVGASVSVPAVGTAWHSGMKVRPLPIWGAYSSDWHKAPQGNAISGIVTNEDATPAAGKIVRLYDRITGFLIQATTTDASGAYSFEMLNSADRYYVVAIGSAIRLAPEQNAVIADDLTPA